MIAVGLGTAIAWATGLAPTGPGPGGFALHLPVPVVGDLLTGLGGSAWFAYVSVILPMGIFTVVGSLQNLESAEAAGDAYPTGPSLAMNGAGTVVAAAFGSCFPTTLYIGHPGWKALGARSGYSVLSGVFMTVVALTGTVAAIAWAIPIDAGMAIVLWIGIVISAQAFQATPRHHAPAVVVGLLPGIAAWGTLMAKNGVRAAGVGAAGGPPFSAELIPAFLRSDTWIHGAFALEQGFIFSSMVLAAATVAVIERRFSLAAAWCGAATLLCASGLMHSYRFTPGDTALELVPAWPWAAGYALMGLIFLTAPLLTRPAGSGHEGAPGADA
jgi:AGZA family xanthine/uracil permease-like MFS transporter